jgi:hypothetical protein
MPAAQYSVERSDGTFDAGTLSLFVHAAPADVLAWFTDALPAAGFTLTGSDTVVIPRLPSAGVDLSRLSFRGHGWKGRIAVPSFDGHDDGIAVRVTIVSDRPPADLRRDRGVSSARRRREYETEALEAASHFVTPGDLAGEWTTAINPHVNVGCFCDRDLLVRRGPNERPSGQMMTMLLSHQADQAWIVSNVTTLETAERARAAWRWVPLDLRECLSFDSTFAIGPYIGRAQGDWAEIERSDDTFVAELVIALGDGRRVVGRKALLIVDRFISSVFAHAIEPATYPDVEPLLDLAAQRLRATVEAFPALNS